MVGGGVGQGVRASLESEVAAYTEHINNLLKADSDLAKLARYLPLAGTPEDFFGKCRDGVLLSHTVNAIKTNTIDFKKLALNINLAEVENGAAPGSKAIFEIQSNQNLFIDGAAKLGIKLVNIGAQDIIDSNADLVLGVVWQLVRFHLLQSVDMDSHPELIRLMEKGEALSTMVNLGPENLLMRWINYHLRRAGSTRKIVNFGESLKDSEALIILIGQVASKQVDQSQVAEILAVKDLEARAKALLDLADDLEVRKFTTVKDLIAGNARLNLGFVATIFNKFIGIRLPTEEEIAEMFSKFDAMQDKISDLENRLAERNQAARAEAEKATAVQTALQSAVGDLSSQVEKQANLLQQSEETIAITRQQGLNFSQQVARLENEIQQSKADLIKSGEEKLVSLQKRYDDMTAELQKRIEELQKEIIALKLERGGLIKDREGLEEKIKHMKELNELMTNKVYQIAEEMNASKKSGKNDRKLYRDRLPQAVQELDTLRSSVLTRMATLRGSDKKDSK